MGWGTGEGGSGDDGKHAEEWARAARGAPRHAFLPETIWTGDQDGTLTPCDVHEDPAVHADGSRGWPPNAPYDRIISTCSVNRIPEAWLTQIRPGGVILTPWDNPWLCYGLLRLTKEDDGTASGRFSPHSAFMLMRGQRNDLKIFRDVVRDGHQPGPTTTTLSPWKCATGTRWTTSRLRAGERVHPPCRSPPRPDPSQRRNAARPGLRTFGDVLDRE